MLLHILSGCGGLINGVAVAYVKRWGRGAALYRAWSRCSIQHRRVLVAAVLLPPLGAAQQKVLVRAGHCGLLYVVQTAFGRVLECGRA